MDSCPNYQRLYSPFRARGERAAARKLSKGNLLFIETEGAANYGITAPVAPLDAFIVQLGLVTCERTDLFVDGKHVDGLDNGARSVQIHDLRRSPISDFRDAFHVLYFYLPRRVLDGLSSEMRTGTVDVMQSQPRAAGARDPVVEHLMLSVLPVMGKPDEMNELFAEHLSLALSTHVATRYGGMRAKELSFRGGLSRLQQHRVLEMIAANLDGTVPLTALAMECGLSVRHFARAFKESLGVPPHRYLLQRRVDAARDLLLNSKLALLDIALTCGFADQSHFTRVFTANVGISPGALRRARGGHIAPVAYSR
jgi:AraC family transcriptional regulator